MTVRPTRWYSNKQEKQVAKALDGKQVANSGASKFCKGDVRTDKFIIECKTCTKEKQSFTISKNWLLKNEEESFAMGKPYSALAFDFGDNKQYYVINEKLFKILKDFLENNTEA